MGSEISRQMRDGIEKWEIVNTDYPDQDNGTKLLNYCIVFGPGQKQCARVLIKVPEHQFGVVDKNSTLQEALCSVYALHTYVSMLKFK
ncbi:hypothetical protein TNCV_912971 [Trichonephila clavipes]|nr:hypothetical protein TNCV_912971 [Trichonephila clavipes]